MSEAARAHRYRRFFETNEVAHWAVGIVALRQFLHARQITSADQLDQTIDKAPSFIEELRPLVQLQDANQATADLYGLKDVAQWLQEAPQSMSTVDIAHSAHAALLIEDGPLKRTYQMRITNYAGEQKVLWISAQIPDLEHIEDGILVSALDITAIKNAESELKEREQFLGAVLRTVPDFLFVYDFESREHIFANGDIGLYLGYGLEQIEEAGEKLLSYIIHPDDRFKQENMAQLRRSLGKDKVYEHTMRIQDSEGEWRYFYFRSAPLEFNEQGEAMYAVVVARDITGILQTEQSLNRQERRFRLLEENFSDVIISTDEHLTVDYVSPSIQHLLGCSQAEFLALDNPQRYQQIGLAEYLGLLVSDYEHALRQCSKLAYEGGEYHRIIESEVRHKNGLRSPVELKISLLLGRKHHEIQGLLITCRDISERRKTEADLRMAAKVFENSLEGIYLTDPAGQIIQVNKAFTTITGYSEEYALGRRPAFLSSGWHDHYFASEIKPVLDTVRYWQGELINRRSSGEVFPAWVGITEVRAKNDEFLGHITSFRDITEVKDSEQRIRKLAYFDPLTDLPNRSLFHDRLNQELQRSQRNKSHVALLFLDLDRFKVINDSMGHATGDRLLTEAARRLRETIRGDDTVARMGGDEFTIILSDLHDREGAESAAAQVSQKVMRILTEPFVLQEREVYISTSIGIAVYPEDGQDGETLLKNADTAMYHAKASGKNGYQFYTEAMNTRSLERLEMQNKLHRAAVDEEFELHFLPIYRLDEPDLNKPVISGVEALIRWRQDGKTLLEPRHFMSVAEESGLSGSLGSWVLNKACSCLAECLEQGASIERVTVNISPMHYADGNLIQHVISALDSSNLAPYQLELEFNENLLMEDIGYTQALLHDLKALGVRISVDDFGTGFSSLHYLRQLPVSSLKIDRRFVQQLPKAGENSHIAQAIIALARSFELNVIAEGVENVLQAEYLSSLGCNEAQGFYYGKPMSERQFIKSLAS